MFDDYEWLGSICNNRYDIYRDFCGDKISIYDFQKGIWLECTGKIERDGE